MRKPARGLAAAGVLAASLASCGTPDNRYKSESGLDLAPPMPLTLDISSQPAPTAPGASAVSLPERAEAAYITALAAKIKDAAAFQAAVAKPPSGGGGGSTERTTLSRILLITVSQQRYYPADRLVFMRVTITPDQGLYAFSGLTAASTSWATQTIDSLDVSNDVKFQPELDATLAGSVVGTLKSPLSVDHATDVKATTVEPYEKLSANIDSQGSLVLTGTGARGVDLVGTSMVKLDFVPSPGYNPNVEHYVDADNFTVMSGATWLPAAKAKITISLISGLRPVAYTATADLVYTVRHVFNGQGLQTYREDDDDVQFLTMEEKCRRIPLATPSDTGLATWEISDQNGVPLKMNTPLGFRQPIFTSYYAAAQFAGWLNAMLPRTIGGWQLTVTYDTSGGTPPITSDMHFSAAPAQIPGAVAVPSSGLCALAQAIQ